MPTYEYVCTECGAPLEAVQSIHDPALTECPSCHGRLRKVFGNVGVVFKGSGFYRTDSRGKKTAGAPATPKADAGASKGSATGTASSSGTGSGSGSTGSSSGSSGSSPAAKPSTPAPKKS